ncbi:Cycloartenol-C-24-methyltransferase [Striga hermonthica]|uniref:Cycloartenol-C-24-methyltransferase n=1 Tax=Striga hermonthica TaxID=68872 RepID=A0A9N7R5C0_STRHE|nr:Cycloartenol-C-24-methyltransferase [Striga hermonthica]
MTDSDDPNNKEHQQIKAEIKLGNGLPDIRLTHQCLDALKKTGFEVIVLEKLGVAPKRSQRVQAFLDTAEGLVAGAKKEIFTSMYFYEDALSPTRRRGVLPA